MTEWDRLWADKPSTAEIWMSIPDFVIHDWLHKVKEVGDRLQEKAELWEELCEDSKYEGES